VRELDAILSSDATLQRRVREVHPELCFWAWNGGVAMAHRKKTQDGRAERGRLIDGRYGAEAANEVRGTGLSGIGIGFFSSLSAVAVFSPPATWPSGTAG